MKRLLITLAAGLFAVTTAQAQIPNTWTRGTLQQLTSDRVDYSSTDGQIANISFTKKKPHSFHSGECFCLILQVIRGRALTDADITENGVTGITVLDRDGRTIWVNSETGASIDSGEKGFDFTVTRDGKTGVNRLVDL